LHSQEAVGWGAKDMDMERVLMEGLKLAGLIAAISLVLLTLPAQAAVL
jgi:hypothetical protein